MQKVKYIEVGPKKTGWIFSEGPNGSEDVIAMCATVNYFGDYEDHIVRGYEVEAYFNPHSLRIPAGVV